MSNLTPEELQKAISNGVQAGIREQEQAAFWIEREKHYKHHELLDNMIKFFDDTKVTVWRTIVRFIIFGGLTLTIGGAIAYIKLKGG
jgi:hypothetical protein